jgi:hypothetical protein
MGVASDPMARIRPGDEARREHDYERFLDELEEDRERRADIVRFLFCC